MNNPENEPKGWDEARTARMIAMVISGAVVVADLYLLVVFLRVVGGLPGGWQAYWYIPVAILGILAFASARFWRHWKALRSPPEPETDEAEE